MMNLILASGSPRRRELLTELKIPFEVRVAAVEESEDPALGSEGLAQYNAQLKAEAVYQVSPDHSLVIGADTVVWLEGRPFGKPKNTQEAVQFLSTFSGKTHQVVTAVTLVSSRGMEQFCEQTLVTFRTLSLDEIESYLSDVFVFDKAGAYAIQEGASRLISHYEGSFQNVVGLPTGRLAGALETYPLFGVKE